jgi:hypothetical protein
MKSLPTGLTEGRSPPMMATVKSRGRSAKPLKVAANLSTMNGSGVINPEGIMNDGKFESENLDLTIFAKIITGNIPIESGM